MEILRIPVERVAVLIGKKGETKKLIEDKAGVVLKIKKDGEIEIEGESANVFFATDVIKAIGRGFEPKKALLLIRDDYQLEVLDLKEYGNTENAIRRLRGRVIGEKGKIKREIERATDCYLSIYGNTIAIIGPFDGIPYAIEAVEKILRGAKHSNVLNYLSRIRKELIATRLMGHKP